MLQPDDLEAEAVRASYDRVADSYVDLGIGDLAPEPWLRAGAVDVVGRLAGDEFVVLVDRRGSPDPGTPVDRLVDRLVEAVRTPVHVVGKHVRVGLSVGVAAAGAAREPFEDVLRRADTAMYVEKAAGRRRGASDGHDEAAADTAAGPSDSSCIARP